MTLFSYILLQNFTCAIATKITNLCPQTINGQSILLWRGGQFHWLISPNLQWAERFGPRAKPPGRQVLDHNRWLHAELANLYCLARLGYWIWWKWPAAWRAVDSVYVGALLAAATNLTNDEWLFHSSCEFAVSSIKATNSQLQYLGAWTEVSVKSPA